MTATLLKSEAHFDRVTGTIGAWVHGVRLDEPKDSPVAKELRRGLHEHGVLFFEFGRVLSADEFHHFAHLFGTPESDYKLGADREAPPYFDSELLPMKEYRVNCWHTDGTVLERPPRAAMLTPLELPELGGDTMWASMYAAWDDLSSQCQRLLEGLEVLHSTARTSAVLRALGSPRSAVHPAVIRDRMTGRKMLYVNSNYSERILGMSEAESNTLLDMLFAHVNTSEFHVRLKWRLGVVAVWDERATQHRGVADFTGPRKMRRLTFAGERPAA
jgi:taurine dioxygenase